MRHRRSLQRPESILASRSVDEARPKRSERVPAFLLRRLLLLGFLALGTIGGEHSRGAEVERTPILERLTPLKSITGIIRSGYALEAEVRTIARCKSGGFSCYERKRFPRIYRIEFELEDTRAEGPTIQRSRQARGTVLLALPFKEEDLRAFDQTMEETMAALSSVSFSLPFGGTRSWFSRALSAYAGDGAYACFDDGESASLIVLTTEITVDENGEESTSGGMTGVAGKNAAETCSALDTAASGIAANEIRTMSLPRLIARDEILLNSIGDLPATVSADLLVALPPGAKFEQGPSAPGIASYSQSRISANGDMSDRYFSETIHDGVFTRAVAAPGDLSPLAIAGRSWIGRWTLRHSEQRLGAAPATTVLAESSLLTVLLPIRPPTPLDEDGQPVDVEVADTVAVSLDTDAFIEDIAMDLGERSDLSTTTLQEIVFSRPAGLDETHWILVACADDGTAVYVMPPSPASSRVTNAQAFCGEAARQLDARMD